MTLLTGSMAARDHNDDDDDGHLLFKGRLLVADRLASGH